MYSQAMERRTTSEKCYYLFDAIGYPLAIQSTRRFSGRLSKKLFFKPAELSTSKAGRMLGQFLNGQQPQ